MSQEPVYEKLTRSYSIIMWIGALFIGIFGFPIGAGLPVYLYYKVSNGTDYEQSKFETWTAILLYPIGILAVEIGGRKGGKIAWVLTIGTVLLIAGILVYVILGMS